MATQLLEEFEENIDEFKLIPSDGGRFEVEVDGNLVYSKLATGQHAEYDDVAVPIRALS